MDFKALLVPYSENGRTIEGIIKWLTIKGLPRNIIDQAIMHVFNEIEGGKVHEDGHALDRYILETAQGFQKAELTKQAEELERFLNTFKQSAVEEYVKSQKGSVWKRVKAVFKPI